MSALKEQIEEAVKKLDNSRDADWAENGRPSLKRIRQLAKNEEIEQDQLDEFGGDVKRDFAKVEGLKPRPDMATARDGDLPEAVKDQWMVATDRGYYGGAIREIGEAFVFSGIPGRWMREEKAAERKARLA